MKRAIVAIVLVWLGSVAAFAKPLEIYFIDVEGGQATLIATPEGQSLLIDAGYGGFGGRDARRILAAAREARIRQIDYLLITHFHSDHDGGVPQLARRIPIRTFIDYGEPVQQGDDVVEPFKAFAEVRRRGQHTLARSGDRVPLTGLTVEIVSAAGMAIKTPLSGAGGKNPACRTFEPRDINPTENARSLGVRLQFGAFRFLDLGDLNWNKLAELVCPDNLLGEVDVYLVPHHGNGDTNVPALLSAVRPRVAIVNNGPTKGGAPESLTSLRRLPGLEDLWQLHRSFNPGAQNTAPALIANLDKGKTGYALILTAKDDGSFSVRNARTGFTRRYAASKPRDR